MMTKDDSIQKWLSGQADIAKESPTKQTTKGGGRGREGADDISIRAADESVEAVADLVKLLVRGGHVFLNIREMEAESNQQWEKTKQRIDLLDAESNAEIRRLEAQLEHAKEKTERLRMVLDVIALKGETLSETYAAGLAKAVEQLTKDG